MFKAPIAIGLSPNTENDDVWQAIKIFFQPWKWKEGNAIWKVEEWFKNYLNTDEVFLFNSGRSALYGVLKSFGIGVGDEILLQAFTCVAVPDPVIWTGAKPVFVDIDETLNIDPELLEKHINKKTKAIIVQHTFGIPAQITLIKKIAQKYNLILIEDCAHALGATVNGQKVGTFGDAAIFSFGRDKVISSVFGGMAIISSRPKVDQPLAEKIKNQKLQEFQKDLSDPSYFWILQQILHPIFFAIILPLYNINIGKLILFIFQKLSLLSKPIYNEETIGGMPKVFPKLYPNASAYLLLVQLEKLDKYNKRRKENADYYFKRLSDYNNLILPQKNEGSIYLRFNILTNKSEEILVRAKKSKIVLGNWYKNIIDPKEVEYEKIGYKAGLCPNAEKMAGLSVNLPTYFRLTKFDLDRIISKVK